MNRYFIELAFKGTQYHGWQRQRNATSVQGVVEETLMTLTRENIKTTGAGRTDTGVHARYFAAHFNSDHEGFGNKPGMLYKMNALLPQDIVIHDIYPVLPDAHARYSALSRTYEYTIRRNRDPFDAGFSWHYPVPLDREIMNQVASRLRDYDDFTSFSKLHGNVKTNICQIHEAAWITRDDRLVFVIRADRFLRNMVRALVGTMVDVGRGKISGDDFFSILEGRNRSLAGFSAPPEGLSLVAIEYPEGIKA